MIDTEDTERFHGEHGAKLESFTQRRRVRRKKNDNYDTEHTERFHGEHGVKLDWIQGEYII